MCQDDHDRDSRLYRMILVDSVSSIVSVRRFKRQLQDGSQLLPSSDSRILAALESAAKEYGLVACWMINGQRDRIEHTEFASQICRNRKMITSHWTVKAPKTHMPTRVHNHLACCHMKGQNWPI